MILGIGKDIVDIRRMEQTFADQGTRFIERCFTKTETAEAEGQKSEGKRIQSYAKRFAAKEATAKALGSGIARGVYLRDIGVCKDELGRPYIELTGGAAKWLDRMTPDKMISRIHATLTDEPPYAEALVIIEALPAEGELVKRNNG